jgi:hypothetical protein
MTEQLLVRRKPVFQGSAPVSLYAAVRHDVLTSVIEIYRWCKQELLLPVSSPTLLVKAAGFLENSAHLSEYMSSHSGKKLF